MTFSSKYVQKGDAQELLPVTDIYIGNSSTTTVQRSPPKSGYGTEFNDLAKLKLEEGIKKNLSN